MMLILRLLVNTGALLVLPYIVSGISVRSVYIALITAIILGILNALIRPVVLLLTFPLTLLTLGLFALVVNGLFLWFVSTFVEGFSVAGFAAAFWGALFLSLISWLTNQLLRAK